ncbi:MAG: hypothetical protein LBJ32_03140 [Oscillospiraceae bacterium]|nr:hypothetical protein [Oscillospiraceae bacterium]
MANIKLFCIKILDKVVKARRNCLKHSNNIDIRKINRAKNILNIQNLFRVKKFFSKIFAISLATLFIIFSINFIGLIQVFAMDSSNQPNANSGRQSDVNVEKIITVKKPNSEAEVEVKAEFEKFHGHLEYILKRAEAMKGFSTLNIKIPEIKDQIKQYKNLFAWYEKFLYCYENFKSFQIKYTHYYEVIMCNIRLLILSRHIIKSSECVTVFNELEKYCEEVEIKSEGKYDKEIKEIKNNINYWLINFEMRFSFALDDEEMKKTEVECGKCINSIRDNIVDLEESIMQRL